MAHAAGMAVEPHREFRIPADDGFELAATLTSAERPSGSERDAVAVIASAAAVPRSYYTWFARFLADDGIPTLTFDYRGIGGSRPSAIRGFTARMRDWGELDIPGILAWVQRALPNRRILWIGHSFGGFGTGLAHNNVLISRQLAVASLSGHWRMMRGFERYRVAVLMGYAAPPLVRALGYFPGRLMGSAADLPRDVFLEWRRWVMTPRFIFGDETLDSRRHFADFRAPIRFVQIEDDPWGTDEAVRHLMGQWPNAQERSLWTVTLAEAGVPRIGHLGFFRPEHRTTLWPKAAAWLTEPDRAGSQSRRAQ